MSTPKDVADWMVKQLEGAEYLYQKTVVEDIYNTFGDKFTYMNDNGNLAISPEVLKEFRLLTEKTVVWVGSKRYWRKKNAYDPLNKRQADY